MRHVTELKGLGEGFARKEKEGTFLQKAVISV